MLKVLVAGIALAAGALVAPAQAQLFNEPFNFSRGGGSVGMSAGYREAIIDEQLTGNRPEFFLRDSSGALVDVQRGANGLAVVRSRTSTILGAGGRSLRGWNYHALAETGSIGVGMIPNPAASIDAWTAMASGLPVPAQGWILRGHQPSPVNAWVQQAAVLQIGPADESR
ncbi:MAG: hypothetical protein R3F55_03555 [Alphaproteobacteria bacterium]